MDTPLEVVIKNSPPWLVPIAMAAVFQFVAVLLAFWLGTCQARKARREEQDYAELLARRSAYRTLLMGEVPQLRTLLNRLDFWIEFAWSNSPNCDDWQKEVPIRGEDLLEFASAITRDTGILADLERAMTDFATHCGETIPDECERMDESYKRDIKYKEEILEQCDRLREIHDTKAAKLDALIELSHEPSAHVARKRKKR